VKIGGSATTSEDLRDLCALMFMDVAAENHVQNGRRVHLRAAFTPAPISRGTVVKSECYIACTGARFEVEADSGRLMAWYRNTPLVTQYKLQESRELSLSSRLPTSSSPPGDGSPNLGGQWKSAKESQFETTETTIIDTAVGDTS
jgi:hypothetical protein